MSDSDLVPLAFQAQVDGRCQIQRLIPKAARQQAYDWVNQWVDGTDITASLQFSDDVQTREYKMTWRVVCNSGQDEKVIRPIIGSRGWAFFPGSSMKGAFLRACNKQEAHRYCGGKDREGNLQPGLLRFHGGYPTDTNWLNDSLVDVVHPQEDWQVNGRAKHSAFIQLSLYQPTLMFGISCTGKLQPDEWEHIWHLWELALARGIGSRVSAGYGQIKAHGESTLLQVGLASQGLASQRIDKTGEFRPNGFKASLRGHTRRLLSGVTDDCTAQRIIKDLWGGFDRRRGTIVGLLGIEFSVSDLKLERYKYGNSSMPIYSFSDGILSILTMKKVSSQRREELEAFIVQLLQFAMLLGGFGKSWRRVDHRLFFPTYLVNEKGTNIKPMIGCHWQFNELSESLCIPINDLADVTVFLDDLQDTVYALLPSRSPSPNPRYLPREAWCKGNVEVWGRIAHSETDSSAIRWFHASYSGGKSIKKSDLSGRMGRIGRIWHRMYPRYTTTDADELQPTSEYVELLTMFPNRDGEPTEVEKTKTFFQFLEKNSDFQKLW